MYRRTALLLVSIFLISLCSPLANNGFEKNIALQEEIRDSSYTSTINNTTFNITGYQEGSVYSPQTAIFGGGSSCQIIESEVWCQEKYWPGYNHNPYWAGWMFGNYSLVEDWPDKYHPNYPEAPLDDLNESYRIDFLPENRTPISIHFSPTGSRLGSDNSICVVLDDGSLTCWQQNRDWITEAQQDLENYTMPTLSLPNSQKITALTIGGLQKLNGNNPQNWLHEFACAITDGESDNVYCFTLWDQNEDFYGGNRYGELGLGYVNSTGEINTSLTNHTFLSADLGGRKATSISAGERHVCAVTESTITRTNAIITDDGYDVKVMCWGDNTEGQLGNGTTGNVQHGYTDPNYYSPTPRIISSSFLPGGLQIPIAVGVVDVMSCALLLNGNVSCWGGERRVQGWESHVVLSNPFVNLSNTETIGLYVGTTDVCVLSSTGLVNCWIREVDYATNAGSDQFGKLNSTHPRLIDLNINGTKPVTLQENGISWGPWASASSSRSVCAIMTNGSYSCYSAPVGIPTGVGGDPYVGPYDGDFDIWNGTIENNRLLTNKSATFIELDADGDNTPLSNDFCRTLSGLVYGCNDYDSDGIQDPIDAFPINSSEWIDTDGDGVGNNADTDDDNDGISDVMELQADFNSLDPNQTPADWDGDGLPDVIDTDDDNDGLLDTDDGPWDYDGDGMPNQIDTDSDDDGVLDGVDTCHSHYGQGWISNSTNDYDSDGCDDSDYDLDDDNDGICDIDGPSNYGSNRPSLPYPWVTGICVKARQVPFYPHTSEIIVDECVTGELGWISNYTLYVWTNNTTDHDSDGCKDSTEDTNDDNDPYEDVNDNCPVGRVGWSFDPNFYGGYSNDWDSDGCHDGYEDEDWDNDGISNSFENQYGTDNRNASDFPTDFDGDGIPDPHDGDDDGDGYLDADDVFPFDASEWLDFDSDGVGDNADLDDDNDGTLDADDAFPFDPSEDEDTDGDGVGNNADAFDNDALEWLDTDGDGVGDNSDNCLEIVNSNQVNSDNDAFGNACDADDDNDGISDVYEIQVGTDPEDPASTPVDFDGDTVPDSVDDDDDNDGTLDVDDDFRFDPCAVLDTDSDGMPDSIYAACSTNLIVDLDDDNDGISDTIEEGGLFTNENCDWQWYAEGISDEFNGHVWYDTSGTEIRHRQPVTYFPEHGRGPEWAPRSITTCDFSYDAFNDSDGDKKTLGNYFTEGDPGQWNQFGDADECVVGHDVMLESMYSPSPGGYSSNWDRMHRFCSDPLDPKSNDTDGDGISDWNEIYQTQECTPQEHLITFRIVRWGDEYIPEKGTICHTNPLVADTDRDGVDDGEDEFPTDPSEWADVDGDGVGDNLDACPDSSGGSDSDSDGCKDSADACPDTSGSSSKDRLGCPDYDRDGYSNPDDIWNISSGADVFPIEPTQWNDTDGDGYGDNPSGYQGDLWPNNASKCCDVDVDGYDDFYEDACPDEYGNSTTDRIGCIDTDGDGFSDKYDVDPNDPNVMTIGSFTRNKVGDKPMITAGGGFTSYGSGDMSVDANAGFLGLIYTNGLREITVKRYDGSTNEWESTTQSIPVWSSPEWRFDPAHIPLRVDESGTLHYVIEDTYYQWDGDTTLSHTFSVKTNINGNTLEADLDIEGSHIYITRMDESMFMHCSEWVGSRGSPRLYYDHSSDGGKTWASTVTKSASGLSGHSVAAGKNGDAHIVYTIMKQGAIKDCNSASVVNLMTLTSSSGLYYMEVKDGATSFPSAEKLTNSSQRSISRDPHIEFHSLTDSVYILIGEISLDVKQVQRYSRWGTPYKENYESINVNGLHFFGKCAGDACSSTYPVNTWYSQKIANGHAGSSYDLVVSDAGVPHAVYKSTSSQVAYVSISGYDFSTTPPTIEWETRFISGTVVSGVGLTLYDESPIIIGAYGNRWNYNVYLFSWDDDGDGLSNWEDYCPYAFGLSTDQTRGCPDTDEDGKTDQVEGTEDESGDSGVFGLPSLSLFSTLMMVVVAAASIHRREQKKDEER